MGQWKRHYQGKAAEIAALDRLAQDNVAMAADAKAEALAFETDLAAAKQRAERAEDSAATATQSLHEAITARDRSETMGRVLTAAEMAASAEAVLHFFSKSLGRGLACVEKEQLPFVGH